ncbi:MAG TPA: T9SS type A sorting domain-containing protein, partial [Bacteroidota bacterium]|nr:T9SS type A sorting domain-containing protein [Bacteroidota bacterium]
ALVYGKNGVRDSITAVDNTYNPSQWYCWLRGCVFGTPVKMDNFMIGRKSPSGIAASGAVLVDADPYLAPAEFSLNQNFPNPFNPTTMIAYELPGESRVSLKIYNLLGQVVQTLSDGIETAGYKSREWDAGRFASGVYFYRLEAATAADPGKPFIQVRRLLLVR